VNAGATALMKLLRGAARIGSRFADDGQRAELRGVTGAVTIEFTGDDGGAWHLDFRDGQTRIVPGAAASPRATVRVRPEDFLALVAGDLSSTVARMTGRVRVAGDGNFGMIFDAVVGGLRNATAARGIAGWVARRLVDRALRKGGYVRRAARAANRGDTR